MNFHYQQQSYNIQRYPSENNRSLKAWSAADEHLLKHLETLSLEQQELIILNDRFGFLTCLMHAQHPSVVYSNKSHEKATYQNLAHNNLNPDILSSCTPITIPDHEFNLGLLKIPKSLDLFYLYLYNLSKNWDSDAVLLCSFMTRHFSPKILTIAETFFEKVEQSKAWKKSRVLTLRSPKTFKLQKVIHQVSFKEQVFQQYFGVFSAKHIDYASQFLIDNLEIPTKAQRILDLASGNGILAASVRQKKPDCELHLLDDAYLAVESSKLNLSAQKTHFHCENTLVNFEAGYFDCVISNPPFHFEYDVSIQTSLQLFKEVQHCLKSDGHFILVANKHLNYKTHLIPLFSSVYIVNENEKFVIYKCSKA